MPKVAFASLPSELMYIILRQLGPQDLANLSTTCKALHLHATDDRLWQTLVQENVPGIDVASAKLPAPITSFRELFAAHHPHWFLPRYKLWISSEGMTGKLVIARYDPRRACIEGYQLLAVEPHGANQPNGDTELELAQNLFGSWEGEDEVESREDIHTMMSGIELLPGNGWAVVPAIPFNPDIHLHMDRPVFHLGPWLAETEQEAESRRQAEAGPRIRTGQHTGPWPLRPNKRILSPRRQQPRSGDDDAGAASSAPPASPEPSGPSDWVRPIPIESSAGQTVNVQFLYARNLSPQEERFHSTFRLSPELRASPPIYVPTIEALTSNGRGSEPSIFQQLAAPKLLMLPARGTSASRDPDHMHLPHPLYRVWPPPNVPTQIPGARESPAREHRIRYISMGNEVGAVRPSYMRAQDHPENIAQVSDRGFHMRTWLNPPRVPFGLVSVDPGEVDHGRLMSPEVMMAAFSTIDPYYYTPTADKPFRGIWVADYGGHGCEFLLIHQPDGDGDGDGNGAPAGTESEAIPQLETESDEDYARRQQDSRIYRGRLEAIKLTGDPNVPRGEYSFFAPNLSAGRILKHGRFAGKRILPAQGHIAGHGFQNDRYVMSRIIAVSYDKLAQIWSGRSYLNYYHRVDIDQYTRPY